MTATEKIEAMLAGLREGKTLYIQTHLRCTKIEQKHVDQWAKAGRALLKASGNDMFMASGKNYVCINFCRITLQ